MKQFYLKYSLYLHYKNKYMNETLYIVKTDLVVLAVSVAATVLRQDAASAIEHVALVTLTALRAFLTAVPLASSRSTLGRAD